MSKNIKQSLQFKNCADPLLNLLCTAFQSWSFTDPMTVTSTIGANSMRDLGLVQMHTDGENYVDAEQ